MSPRDPASGVASPYVGRFAPSPTGPLHLGSLVAALASYLDARAHAGRWLLRIEDLDRDREVPGASAAIIDTLSRLGFEADGEIVRQSERHALYQAAFERLQAMGRVYPCGCTRREIADSLVRQGATPSRHGERVYPGTCRAGLPAGRVARAWRLRVDSAEIDWQDRLDGTHHESLAHSVGDFVLRRADGWWAYQLAVVVDDHDQGITTVVRGADLRESTARQILLQSLLGYARPAYLHVPVVVDANGEKLSKQTGAAPIDVEAPLQALDLALRHLGLAPTGAATLTAFWPLAQARWRDSRYFLPPSSAATGREA